MLFSSFFSYNNVSSWNSLTAMRIDSFLNFSALFFDAENNGECTFKGTQVLPTFLKYSAVNHYILNSSLLQNVKRL